MSKTPVLGFAAFSGTGKTTLLTRLIPHLTASGLTLGLIKHAHHRFEIDRPGKDSHTLREAGARQVLVGSENRTVFLREFAPGHKTELDSLIDQLDGQNLDLILVEGFKRGPIPKIELHRPSLGNPELWREDEYVVAVATDAPVAETRDLPVLDLNNPEEIAGFVIRWLG